jgi:hypothetical protein
MRYEGIVGLAKEPDKGGGKGALPLMPVLFSVSERLRFPLSKLLIGFGQAAELLGVIGPHDPAAGACIPV